MRANELQIGDWVLCDMNAQSDYEFDTVNYQPFQIKSGEDIDYACERNMSGDADVYQPILLTKEILEKNGWVKYPNFYRLQVSKDYDEWCIEAQVYEGGIFSIDADHKVDENLEGDIYNMRVEFVHELQHILNILDLDREIVL